MLEDFNRYICSDPNDILRHFSCWFSCTELMQCKLNYRVRTIICVAINITTPLVVINYLRVIGGGGA